MNLQSIFNTVQQAAQTSNEANAYMCYTVALPTAVGREGCNCCSEPWITSDASRSFKITNLTFRVHASPRCL